MKPDGEWARMAARVASPSRNAISISLNGMPATFIKIHGRSDQLDQFLVPPIKV